MEHEITGCRVMGNWIVGAKIGEGSFGKVYEIERREFGEVYRSALKIIRVPQSDAELQGVLNEGMTHSQARDYFYSVVQDIVREYTILSKLKGTANVVGYEDHEIIAHPNGIGWDILIRMELLHPLLGFTKVHRMSRRHIIQLGIDICSALELCQRYNVIHRDIKPENIFVSDNGVFKLGDFGIARTIERTTAGLSKKGTYQYMAPEVYHGYSYGFSVDTYSLGLVLYRMLNQNRLPFMPPPPAPITHNCKEESLARRLTGEPFPLPFYGQNRLGEIILKACAYDPAHRYSSPQQMRQELEAVLYEEQDASLIYPEGDTLSINSNVYVSHTPPEYRDGHSGTATSGAYTNDRGSWDPSNTLGTSGTAGTAGVFKKERKGSYTPIDYAEPKKKIWPWVCAGVAAVLLITIALVIYFVGQRNDQERYDQLMHDGLAICETDPDQAKDLFKQAQSLRPEEAAPYTSYAYALYRSGDYETCATYIEDELALGKQFALEDQSELSEILGAAYFELEDYAKAAAFFRLCTAGRDITQNAQRDYAVSLGRLGDVNAADEVLAQMYAAGAGGDVTDYVQAEVDYAREEYVAAEQGFRSVLNTTDDPVLQKRALRSLGEVYRDCAALVRTSNSPISTPATKAVEVLSWGIEEFGLRYDAAMWEMLALAYFEAYHTDTAAPADYLRKSAECFNRVVELGVVKDYLYSNLYTVYYEMQDYEQAEKTLQDFEAAFPDHYEPHAFRAMMLITIENNKSQSARDYSGAVAEYEIARQMIRGDDDATQLQQLESYIDQLRSNGWLN